MRENWFRKSPSPLFVHSKKNKKVSHLIDANRTYDLSTLSKSNTIFNSNYQCTNKPCDSIDFSPNFRSYYQTMSNTAKPIYSDIHKSKIPLLYPFNRKTIDFEKEQTSLKDQYKKFEDATNLIINSFKA